MKPLYEQYRPQSFAEVVGNDTTISEIEFMRRRTGLGGQVFWLSGLSGTGKTSIARLIAADVADEFNTIEIDAKKLNVEELDEWTRLCRFKALTGPGFHAFIVNEAHNLRAEIVSRLQTVLEETHVQLTSTWIFTTTTDGQQKLFESKFDCEAFLSRAKMFELGSRGKELEFALRVREIAQAENLDGQPLDVYLNLAKRCVCNMRKMLNEVEMGRLIAK